MAKFAPDDSNIVSLGLMGQESGGLCLVESTDGRITRIRPADGDTVVLSPLILGCKLRIYSKNRVKYPLKRVDWDPRGERNPQNRGISGYERISAQEAEQLTGDEFFRIKKVYGAEAILYQTGIHSGDKPVRSIKPTPGVHKTVYIRPELNYKAAVCSDKWIPILPNSGAVLRLAIAYQWLTQGDCEKESADKPDFDFDAAYVLGNEDGVPKTPEWASEKCGVPEWTIKALAREYAKKEASIVFGDEALPAAEKAREYRFENIVYPEPGLPIVHMIWTDDPSRTVCGSDGNMYIRALRDDSVETVVAQYPWFENDCCFADIIIPADEPLEGYTAGFDLRARAREILGEDYLDPCTLSNDIPPKNNAADPRPVLTETGENTEALRAEKYPLLCVSEQGRWRYNASCDDISWNREIDTMKLRCKDGYLYEPVWLSYSEAEKRGIIYGDIVKIYNERGIVLCGAYVTQRIIDRACYVSRGARIDPISAGYLDRGGALGTIAPDTAACGFSVEIKKVTDEEMAAWKSEFPEAFSRTADFAAGVCLDGWLRYGEVRRG